MLYFFYAVMLSSKFIDMHEIFKEKYGLKSITYEYR